MSPGAFLEVQEMVMPTGCFLVVLPCPRGAGALCAQGVERPNLARAGGLPTPRYLPTFPPDHFAGGVRELQGSSGEDTTCLVVNGPQFGGFVP